MAGRAREEPNILRGNLNNTGPFRWWIREALLDNKPMDRFATELITVEGSASYGGPSGFAIASQNDLPMAAKAQIVSSAFLANEMKYARCHDAPNHPFEQGDLFKIAAILQRAPLKMPKKRTPLGKAEHCLFIWLGGGMSHLDETCSPAFMAFLRTRVRVCAMSPNITAMLDTLHRPLRDLRLSVTDRCNFRCGYCMPKEIFGRGYDFLPKENILTFEELARISRVFVALGVEKIRITGGEPTLRRDIERLVAQLATIEGLRDLTLTTNGSTLAEKARALRDAGLRRLTVSLDSLDGKTFAAMNDMSFPLHRVLAGIEAARTAGFSPIKLNMVVKRGVNDGEVAAMAKRFAGPDFIVRYIEYMDVGNTNGWRMTDVVPASEIIARIGEVMPLTPIARNYPGETALRFRTANGGEIGVIASVTKPFCGDCTRARLTADGTLFTCLFASHGTALRDFLRSGASDDALMKKIGAVWKAREDRYSEIRSSAGATMSKVEMSRVGG